MELRSSKKLFALKVMKKLDLVAVCPSLFLLFLDSTAEQDEGVEGLLAERKVFEIGSSNSFVTQLFASFQTEVWSSSIP